MRAGRGVTFDAIIVMQIFPDVFAGMGAKKSDTLSVQNRDITLVLAKHLLDTVANIPENTFSCQQFIKQT